MTLYNIYVYSNDGTQLLYTFDCDEPETAMHVYPDRLELGTSHITYYPDNTIIGITTTQGSSTPTIVASDNISTNYFATDSNANVYLILEESLLDDYTLGKLFIKLNGVLVPVKAFQKTGGGASLSPVEISCKEATPIDVGYLTFSSPSTFTLNVTDNTKHWDGTLEYSTDITNWGTWDGTTILSAQSDGTKYVLYIRGSNNTYITGNTVSTVAWVLTGSNIFCNGNIENLLDYQTVVSGNHPNMANYCYSNIFYGCSSLITAPTLPATTLAKSCYYGMFHDCSSLTMAPELPATILEENCYYYMFYGCASLTTAPTLPATTLAKSCYHSMFRDCTELVTIPVLPAITLASGCYVYMFRNCTKIKLSATQTGEYQIPYRIPTEGTGIDASVTLTGMFRDTGGTFTDKPVINTTYYLSNTNTIIS